MKKTDLKQLVKKYLIEGFQGDEPIGDGLSGFRGNEGGSGVRLKKLKTNSNQLNKLIQDLVDKGYKEYQLDIKNNYGVYFITLPYQSLSTPMLANLIRILPEGSSIGIYPNLHSGLSIRTSISI